MVKKIEGYYVQAKMGDEWQTITRTSKTKKQAEKDARSVLHKRSKYWTYNVAKRKKLIRFKKR